MRLLFAASAMLFASWTVPAQTYTISTFAGGGLPVNIPGPSASLYGPRSVAVDKAGNVFFVDGNTVLRMDATTGILTLVAGNGTPGFSGDNGPATSAQLDPSGVAVDSAGNLYVADSGNNRVRKVSNGVITTVAGNGAPGFGGDNGPATTARLAGPSGVAVDSADNLYIADDFNARVRKVSNGVITTVAGNGTYGFGGDNGPAISAQLHDPVGVAVDSAGNLYIADFDNHRVRKVSNGVITTVAGGGSSLGDNGPATSARLNFPYGVAVDSVGNLYIADSENWRARKVSNGVITTVAGNGTQGFSGDNGPATSAQLFIPSGVAVDSVGNLYIADTGNNRVRKVSNGVITTAAGNGTQGFIGDNGLATSAQLYVPSGVAVDSAGNLYIADIGNNRVRKVSNGVITTAAGDGARGFGGDNGLATGAQLFNPFGVAVDSAGNLYIADSGNNRVRKVSNGVITTVAGNGAPGFGGDNGPATSAQLDDPSGVAVDSAGNLYVADSGNNRVRKVSNGVITTVAGNGAPGFGGDSGPATSAQLDDPSGVAVDSAGNLYVADSKNNRARKVSNAVITTVGFGFDYPPGVAVDPTGNVYIADTFNNRIRLLTPNAVCSYAVTPTSLSASASGGSLTVTVQTPAGCTWAIPGLPNWVTTAAPYGVGSATVTLAVQPNSSGATRSANLTIAGTQIGISQQAACTYSINPGGQALATAGGSGTIAVAAGAGCSWSASSSASWVTFTGTTSGTSNGTVSYQVAANTGAARSGTITVAGLPFTVEESSATITGLASAGSMAQLASGGPWTTTITLVNTGSTAAQTRLNFFGDDGNPATLPWTFPQLANASGPTLAATLDRTLNPGAQLVLQTTNSTGTAVAGWAQLLSNGAAGSISGYAVFSAAIGSSVQDAVAPLETRTASTYVLAFDNTNGNGVGVALANLTTQPLAATMTLRDDTGATLLSDKITLPTTGHTSFVLTDRYGAFISNKRGTVSIATPSPGQISVIGIRANATGAFSDIPPFAQ